MNSTLARFLEALRHADLQISPAEAIDAYRTMSAVGSYNRWFLRDALTISLGKSSDDQRRVEETFDKFFMPQLEEPQGQDSGENVTLRVRSSDTEQTESKLNPEMLNPDAMNAMGAGGASDMAQMMMAGDTAGVLASLQGAAREVGLERMWLFTQKNQFTRRMLETMGLRELERAIGRAERDGDEGLQAQLSALRSAMFDRARDYVEREFELFAKDTARRLADERLLDAQLHNIDSRDKKRMAILVKKLAKRLASMYANQQKREKRGQLNVRKTMRRNHHNDDLMFHIEWKQKRIDKPKVIGGLRRQSLGLVSLAVLDVVPVWPK